MNHRRQMIIIFNFVMIITAITLAVMFGIAGYGRPHGPQDFSLYDFSSYIYPAGKMWLNGLNPYDGFFPYPPNSALFCMLLSVTNLETSKILFWGLNILCILLWVYLCMKLYNHQNREKIFFLFDVRLSILISMLVGNVYIFNVLWVGQTSIFIAAALLASYYFYFRSSEISSGIFLAFALNKPQLAYTFFVWLVLEKKWKTLAASIVTTIILGIVPIYNRGIITTTQDWINVLNEYIQVVNRVCFWNLFGLQPLFKDFGIQIGTPVIFICSIILIILIHKYYATPDIFELYGILTIIGLLLGQASQYDLIIIAPMLTHYLMKISIHDFKKVILLCLTFMIMNFPRSHLLLSDFRILHHHRVIILIIMLLSLLFWRAKHPPAGILQNPGET